MTREKAFNIWILILCWIFSSRNWVVYKNFLFEAARPGIVKAQLVANGAFTEFNLLKTRKASVSEIAKEIKSFSILVLTPPPLDYKRQEYLYHNIRSFVRINLKILLDHNQFILAMNKIFRLKFINFLAALNFPSNFWRPHFIIFKV